MRSSGNVRHDAIEHVLRYDTLYDLLTPEERATMQEHAEIGARLLSGSDITLLDTASDIARHHHEKYDGSGYPQGLKGDEIPCSARIVTIVDVYDALIHKRVYKPAIPEDEVIRMMQDMAGTQLDPDLLEVFINNLPTMRRIRQQNPDETTDDATDIANAQHTG